MKLVLRLTESIIVCQVNVVHYYYLSVSEQKKRIQLSQIGPLAP